MSYLALYRKYRPSNFEDLVGQNSVSSIIKNEILSNKLSHAYLFSGPRGTGKTSTAKIIAKMINCNKLSKKGIPCGKCDSCLNFNSSSDVVEIDAASNNGVDEIRDIRDKVNLVPTYGKYKVYIIDEVHMLTTQAFNALLKTLEEPPSHVIFILATTEFYKIPATVVSRCQKFQFFKFSNDEIIERLSKIASLENISVNNDILNEIARLSDGGMRDAINMLDQLSSFSDDISINDLYMLNGIVSYIDLANLLKYIYNKDVINIVDFINNLDKEGKNFDRFINDLLYFLKDFLLIKNNSDIVIPIKEKKNKIMELYDLFSIDDLYNFIFTINDLNNKLKISSYSSILVITCFVKLSNDLNVKDDGNVKIVEDFKDVFDNSVDKVNNEVIELNVDRKQKNVLDDEIKKIRINNSFATASKQLKDSFVEKWVNLKNIVDINRYSSVIGFIDDMEVLVVGNNNVIFKVNYDSLIDRVYDYLDEFESLLKEVYNNEYRVIIITSDEWKFEKDNYVSNIKKGYKYTYIDEVDNNDSISKQAKNTDLDKVIDLLGDDVIVYE
ncbi:MAG: DNA polymerase III subunit gamma/tau [Bacilli bacterium]|nr:DNA polymerase III subunit gamma/tau [Bacilli bacterium]